MGTGENTSSLFFVSPFYLLTAQPQSNYLVQFFISCLHNEHSAVCGVHGHSKVQGSQESQRTPVIEQILEKEGACVILEALLT